MKQDCDQKSHRSRKPRGYSAYLRSAHWQRTRRAALRRARHRCERCGSPEFLEVHHRSYERLEAEVASDLEVLCSRHHAEAHHRRDRHGNYRAAVNPAAGGREP